MSNDNFILILTNKEDITCDYVILELQKRKVPYLRINTEDFPKLFKIQIKLSNKDINGFILSPKGKFDIKNIISIYYRRPIFESKETEQNLKDFYERELRHSLIGMLLSLKTLWVNNPLNNRNAEYKLNQLFIAKKIGFNIPSTLLTQFPREFIKLFQEKNKKVITKTIKKGHINGENGGVIYTSKINAKDLHDIELLKEFPTLFQEELNKKYDIRMTIVGEKIFCTKIDSQGIEEAKTDWRKSQNLIPKHSNIKIPQEIIERCMKIMEHYNLIFGTIDLVLTKDDKYYFLELNPNGQWAWIQEQTGVNITKVIVDILLRGGKDENK